MMFRRISEVPPSMEFPRLRSWRCCHRPSSTECSPPDNTAYGPSISSASEVRAWFVSYHTSLAIEPSGPGMPVARKDEYAR